MLHAHVLRLRDLLLQLRDLALPPLLDLTLRAQVAMTAIQTVFAASILVEPRARAAHVGAVERRTDGGQSWAQPCAALLRGGEGQHQVGPRRVGRLVVVGIRLCNFCLPPGLDLALGTKVAMSAVSSILATLCLVEPSARPALARAVLCRACRRGACHETFGRFRRRRGLGQPRRSTHRHDQAHLVGAAAARRRLEAEALGRHHRLSEGLPHLQAFRLRLLPRLDLTVGAEMAMKAFVGIPAALWLVEPHAGPALSRTVVRGARRRLPNKRRCHLLLRRCRVCRLGRRLSALRGLAIAAPDVGELRLLAVLDLALRAQVAVAALAAPLAPLRLPKPNARAALSLLVKA
mmetsp:Transcript_108412/g.346043  ORF Transcript_108412/g.346043 Transcript_108412/m.346043 type:complete len:348 (-) Transcript_108412:468-1511(-)